MQFNLFLQKKISGKFFAKIVYVSVVFTPSLFRLRSITIARGYKHSTPPESFFSCILSATTDSIKFLFSINI
ncbi:MAG: hypothetical protein A2275_00940 [Bacteroidetes bacterium RIFOXYA12_FULL_35_11]|nr:MAG: hypothetical protein A2275_00940 [Bacteroidetes bacterium RIFOXYA12_FULL_35_11]OFY93023.1 MAG: hypothetical protein A2491_00105 [Bacteroidetes bacterium RIFOXYC12_FULL_35_7]OFY95492.1 MAG: hypothetical protein A2309_10315 [Bacteroidetes bacterium RIFOXYB2_FULL_35_7]HBX53007.1 hypothetical protein [Bacteroidales bacterium]